MYLINLTKDYISNKISRNEVLQKEYSNKRGSYLGIKLDLTV